MMSGAVAGSALQLSRGLRRLPIGAASGRLNGVALHLARQGVGLALAEVDDEADLGSAQLGVADRRGAPVHRGCSLDLLELLLELEVDGLAVAGLDVPAALDLGGDDPQVDVAVADRVALVRLPIAHVEG